MPADESRILITVESVIAPEGVLPGIREEMESASVDDREIVEATAHHRAGTVRSGPARSPEVVLSVKRLGTREFTLGVGSATDPPYGPVVAYGVEEAGLLDRWTHWRLEERPGVQVAVSSFRAPALELRGLADQLDHPRLSPLVAICTEACWVAVEMVITDPDEKALAEMVSGPTTALVDQSPGARLVSTLLERTCGVRQRQCEAARSAERVAQERWRAAKVSFDHPERGNAEARLSVREAMLREPPDEERLLALEKTAERAPVVLEIAHIELIAATNALLGARRDLRDTFELEDNGKVRDNIVLEVTEISANVYNQKKLIPIETGDFVCIGMGPKTLNGHAKFMTEGKTYGIEYLGEGEAKKAGHNPPKLFDVYEVLDDEPSKEASDDTVVGSVTGENGDGYADETDDGEPPY